MIILLFPTKIMMNIKQEILHLEKSIPLFKNKNSPSEKTWL